MTDNYSGLYQRLPRMGNDMDGKLRWETSLTSDQNIQESKTYSLVDLPMYDKLNKDDVTTGNDDVGALLVSGYLFIRNTLLTCMPFLGLFCVIHVTINRRATYKNASIMTSIAVAGLCFVLAALNIVNTFNSTMSAINCDVTIVAHGRSDLPCVDFTFPSMLTLAVSIFTIVHHMIRRHVTSKMKSLILNSLLVASMVVGLTLIFKDGLVPSKEYEHGRDQETVVTLNRDTVVVWSLCRKRVSRELSRLVLEYGLVYGPSFAVALCCLCVSIRQCQGTTNGRFRITRDECDMHDRGPCFCPHLDKVLAGILGVSFLFLFLARPTQLVNSYFTSGLFRDVLPGHLCTMIYFVICGEYLVDVWRSRRGERECTISKVKMHDVV